MLWKADDDQGGFAFVVDLHCGCLVYEGIPLKNAGQTWG